MGKSVLDALSQDDHKRLRKRRQPAWTQPMLAVLTHDQFSDDNWIFERKLDGVRCLAFRKGNTTKLMSRNRNKMNVTYPEIVDALSKQKADDFIVDGEIVAFEGSRTSFSRLQDRIGIHREKEARASKTAVYFYVFDILHVAGHDTSKLPQLTRKGLLKKTLHFTNPLRYTAHRRGSGEDYYKEACRKGWEGVVAKKADARYSHSRSRNWLKFKCRNQQEFVVGGYTDPQGSRIGFGSLVIGYYERGTLRYAGHVGTGFDHETLRDLSRRLKKRNRQSSPFKDKVPAKGDTHWVTPQMVIAAGFTEWTDDGRLRHPRYLGLRTDKKPKSVTRES